MSPSSEVGVRVVSTVRVEGFHAWPGAIEGVEFLASRHRHVFHVRVEVPVSHGDREVEIILLGRRVAGAIREKFGCPAEFGSMSCEAIAAFVLDAVGASRVEVLEDGENGAACEVILRRP